MANWKVKLTYDRDQWIGKRTRLGKDAWMGHTDWNWRRKQDAVRYIKEEMEYLNEQGHGTDYAALLVEDLDGNVVDVWFTEKHRTYYLKPFSPAAAPDYVTDRLDITPQTRHVWITYRSVPGGGGARKAENVMDADTRKSKILSRSRRNQDSLGWRTLNIYNTNQPTIAETRNHPLYRRYGEP